MNRRINGGGRADVGSVPASVNGGIRPHVRERFRVLAAECVQSAEAGEMTGAALALLSVLAEKAVKGGVSA